jgi:hypothetical protein
MSTNPIQGNQYFSVVKKNLTQALLTTQEKGSAAIREVSGSVAVGTTTAAPVAVVDDQTGACIQLPVGALILSVMLTAPLTLTSTTSTVVINLGSSTVLGETALCSAVTAPRINNGVVAPFTSTLTAPPYTGVTSARPYLTATVGTATLAGSGVRVRVLYSEKSVPAR